MITEGREKISWDINCICKAVHPRNLENPRDKQKTRDDNIPTELHQTSGNNKETGDKNGDPRGKWVVKREQISRTKHF